MQDPIDLLIVTIWTYGCGFIFGWLIEWGLSPHQTGSLFAFIGVLIGIWGIEWRRWFGKFPGAASILIFALPFTCIFAAIIWRVMLFLGLIKIGR